MVMISNLFVSRIRAFGLFLMGKNFWNSESIYIDISVAHLPRGGGGGLVHLRTYTYKLWTLYFLVHYHFSLFKNLRTNHVALYSKFVYTLQV